MREKPKVKSPQVRQIVKLPMPKNYSRIETGIIQFGNDWPGVFIRGDNAAYFAMILRQLLELFENSKAT